MSHEFVGNQIEPIEKVYSNETLEIPINNYLYTEEENRQLYACNGSVLAEITLPVQNGSGEDKKLHIIDFGEDFDPSVGAYAYHLVGTGDLKGVGKCRTRFAIHGVNYTPEDHMLAFAQLANGEEITLGREDNFFSHSLGLADTVRDSRHNDINRTLSRKHFSIKVDERGRIFLADHSTNGTMVKSFPVTEQ